MYVYSCTCVHVYESLFVCPSTSTESVLSTVHRTLYPTAVSVADRTDGIIPTILFAAFERERERDAKIDQERGAVEMQTDFYGYIMLCIYMYI